MIKETYITESIRVRISEAEGGRFWISTEQDANNIPGMPWEKGEDGWRDCMVKRANTMEEAEAEYNDMIECERRYHR